MSVEFYNTKKIPEDLKNAYIAVFEKTISEDNLVEGSACRSFEEKFAKYLDIKFVLGVGNGFDAIRISLLALGIGPGDRVAVPAHTFIATWFAVQSVGAIPVGVDVTGDGQLDLDLLEREIGLACVIPVHMHGTHCDMKRLVNWARRLGIRIIEDCAQAAGLSIQGKKAGTWGDVGAFSFYPTKNLFALGDGGAISTNHNDIYEAARSVSRYGTHANDKYTHIRLGQNSRLDTLQAAFLEINLQNLDQWNLRRSQIAEMYDENLGHLRPNLVDVQESVFHHYVIYIDNRDNLKAQLAHVGISTEIHYPNFAASEVNPNETVKFPVASGLSSRGLSLPISPWQTLEDTDYVVDKVLRILNGRQ